MQIRRYQRGDETTIGFLAPITFQGKTVGQVDLGIPERPLTRVAQLSLGLMAVLVLVTVLSVAVAMYFAVNWFSKPIRVLRHAMSEIELGRLQYRITEKRRDEYGAAYTAFNRMARALDGSTPLPPDSVPAKPEGSAPTSRDKTPLQDFEPTQLMQGDPLEAPRADQRNEYPAR